mmetsp:Transcript_22815/g.25354  ORF Transcript_22815/g.25354 Transcript_22815/m.25354 type:complete len:199 (-) Transcript_22815:43-639(-)
MSDITLNRYVVKRNCISPQLSGRKLNTIMKDKEPKKINFKIRKCNKVNIANITSASNLKNLKMVLARITSPKNKIKPAKMNIGANKVIKRRRIKSFNNVEEGKSRTGGDKVRERIILLKSHHSEDKDYRSMSRAHKNMIQKLNSKLEMSKYRNGSFFSPFVLRKKASSLLSPNSDLCEKDRKEGTLPKIRCLSPQAIL